MNHKIIKKNSGHLSFSSYTMRESYCGILIFDKGHPEDPQKRFFNISLIKIIFMAFSYIFYFHLHQFVWSDPALFPMHITHDFFFTNMLEYCVFQKEKFRCWNLNLFRHPKVQFYITELWESSDLFTRVPQMSKTFKTAVVGLLVFFSIKNEFWYVNYFTVI